MIGILKTLISMLVALVISSSVSSMSEVTPEDAAEAFLQNLSAGDAQTAMIYMDNKYINFLENVKGTNEEMDRLEDALFRNFSYEIKDSATKNNVAVVEAELRNCDFSGIMKDYEEESFEYVTENLYSDTVTDKEKLNKKCLDIYIDQITQTAEKEPSMTTTVFIPMEADGYGGWHILLTDETMEAALGELELPTSK